MTLLLIGVALWWTAHLFKRLAPGARGALSDRLGDGSKGIVAVLLLVSIILMVLGYRAADFTFVYALPAWTIHLNNLLMLISFILFGMGSSKSQAKGWFRHPMLMGFAVWAIAHLLVNGDLASIILFGGLLLWVPVTMVAINTAEPDWDRPTGGTLAGDIRLVVIGAVLTVVVGYIHGWIGPWPFAGG